MPHLDAAYDLARWLTRRGADADDIVQESFVRALRFFASFRGENPRSWLLAIVRNCYFQRLDQARPERSDVAFDEEIHTGSAASAIPDSALRGEEQRQLLRAAIERLPLEFREIVVLREIQDLSYREIAESVGIPIGTVMSRLARARGRLQRTLNPTIGKDTE